MRTHTTLTPAPVDHLADRVTVRYIFIRPPSKDVLWRHLPHKAEMERLFLITQGQAEVHFRDKRYHLTEGMILLCPAEVHMGGRVLPESPFLCQTLHYTARVANGLHLSHVYPPALCQTGQTVRRVAGLFDQISQLRHAKAATAGLLRVSLILQILTAIYQTPDSDIVSALPPVRDNDNPFHQTRQGETHIRDAVTVMMRAAEMGEALNISELAEKVGIHRTYLSRLFKQYTGLPPGRFLEQLRIDEARSKLRNQKLSISRVAEEVGYHDPYHFSRVFKRVVGMSPSEFRAHQNLSM